MKVISIAKDFSVYPGGRTPEDGLFSGQEFRDTMLMPIFSGNEQVQIDFDGVRGYGSSFLEESFGGLVRNGIPKDRIHDMLRFCSTKDSIIAEVNRYIKDAHC